MDNIPLGLKIFYLPFSYLVGAIHWLSIVLLHLSCRVEIKGRENLEMAPHHILCLWHFAWWPCFVSFGRVPYRTMLNHPLRYMKPLHVMLYFLGVKKLILISPGKDSKKAILEMIQVLKGGQSTWISPDGPSGPPKKLKKGVYFLARESGVPILPVRFSISRYLVLPSWDKKQVPLPFSKITVEYSKPIKVKDEEFDEISSLLAAQL